MQAEIKCIVKEKCSYKVTTIFGYTTSGIPGLEVLGLGAKGRVLKEKIIYLSRCRKIQIPSKRYVLSLEDIDHKYLNLIETEFAFLLLFWNLAGVIKIYNLSNCLSFGELKVSGEVHQKRSLYEEAIKTMVNFEKPENISEYNNYKVITGFNNSQVDSIIPVVDILRPISNFKVKCFS